MQNMEVVEETTPRRRLGPNLLIAHIDSVLDAFYLSDYTDAELSISNLETSTPTQIKHAISYYQELLDELNSTDPQVREGYAKLSRKQKKTYIEFVTMIIDTLNQTKINRRRANPRKQRKPKLKSAAQLTRSVKYLIEDKELNVTSLTPDGIIGANAVWLFNTKTRKLAKYQAKESQALSMKGTTILNFDEKLSSQKTIRKPKDMVSLVMREARNPLAKAYDQVRAVAAPVNGRINGYTLILRIIK